MTSALLGAAVMLLATGLVLNSGALLAGAGLCVVGAFIIGRVQS